MAAIPDHQFYSLTRLLSSPISPNFNYLIYSTLLVSILLPAYRFVIKDYHDFLSLGPGGTPSTFAGYLRVSCLRLFTIKDPLTPPCVTPTTLPTDGYLLHLPFRPGPRPAVAGIAPHRQLNQKSSSQLHQHLRNALHSLAAAYPNGLRKGNSCFEKHGLALFLSSSFEATSTTVTEESSSTHIQADMVQQSPFPAHINQTCADTAEICHLHASVRCAPKIGCQPAC